MHCPNAEFHAGGAERTVGPPILDNGYSPFEVSPDGQRFLVRAAAEQVPQPLTIIVNWPALLNPPRVP
jgi:hypothetical protein